MTGGRQGSRRPSSSAVTSKEIAPHGLLIPAPGPVRKALARVVKV